MEMIDGQYGVGGEPDVIDPNPLPADSPRSHTDAVFITAGIRGVTRRPLVSGV